mgnify:CR=1 FL=1
MTICLASRLPREHPAEEDRIGGVTFDQATAVGHMPASLTDLADGDLLDITSGEWAGSVFRVVEAVKGDQHTARRVPIVEVPRPEEWA